MVRVAGLKGQVKAGFNKPENKEGLTPKQQLVQISRENHRLIRMQYDTYSQKLLPELQEENICLVNINALLMQKNSLKAIFFCISKAFIIKF